MECHGATSGGSVAPGIVFTDPSGTSNPVSGPTAVCTSPGSGSVSSFYFAPYVKASSSIYPLTTLVGTPPYDIHAECSIINVN